ncbi:hypothetical protein ANSO36C_48780 [Nostoc cf. commune SO-36]|uniref:Tyr recombinase domain-containing protein n=1 Tax=Nostoc cf. commune SO-36 TaxID=449208 RepID=A0ABM7Z7D3_NOSCO|nr:tyrosine-type recombinase/integrase [Nostoc commune]BDI19076.1 hypothetical protein ANSO36C_48780 [Nostoc cf. commune SO-36]
MVNSNKTPTGKAKKGQVTVRVDSESIKACFPRPYFPGEPNQVKIGTGISLVDGWEDKASKLQRRLQIELEDGKLSGQSGTFNRERYREILEEYGMRPNLKIVSVATSDGQLPPKPELSLMEIWDMYCDYRKQGLRESTFKNMFLKQFNNYIKSAIEATKSEDALKIRNWLIENRNLITVKQLLSNLSKAYRVGIKNKLLTHNPFEGMAEEVTSKGAQGKTKYEVETENDNDVLDRGKAYTWDEAQAILNYIKNNSPHWYNFTKFKFFTGCRTGEAIGFMWCDVEWDKERILIRRTYDRITKKFYPLKNNRTYKGEEIRRFPMPKDGELWSFLKLMPQGEQSEVVFKSKIGRVINSTTFGNSWRGQNSPSIQAKGIIPTLIKQGDITKYLPPYNTRHTFITHAVFDLDIDEKVVSKWCGHKIETSNKHYQDIAIFADKTNPEVPMNKQVQYQARMEQLEDQLRQQQELIDKLLKSKKE